MDDLARILIQWLHVASGVLWIGGGIYTIFVQLPALAALPPQARGPAMLQLIPRQLRYLTRVAELTIASGVANVFVSGRAQQLAQPLGSRWAVMIGLGIVLALVLYGIVTLVVRPLARRVLTLIPAAGGGDAAAAQQLPALGARLRTIGFAQLAIGLVILLVMVTARFS